MITIHYTVHCDALGCSEAVETQTPFALDEGLTSDPPIPRAVMPDGWRVVDEHIVCPKHKVAIDDVVTQLGTFPAP